MAEWWEELFDDRYLRFHEGVLPLEPATADAAFLDRALALDPGSHILDLGCGFGRHAVALAARGYRVTGVDLSARMLEHARGLAERAGVEVQWLRRDMRELGGLGPFDACVCLFTVLGYFDDEQNARVVRGIRDTLRPEGRLALDLTNPLALMKSWPGTFWREHDRGVSRETAEYDPRTGRLTATHTLFGADGRREDSPTSVVRMYAPHETAKMLAAAGFEVEQLHGALRDEPFRWNRSAKQVWIARRT